MDVCMTKDKQIVVVHDSHLKRICGVDKYKKDLNYKEIPQIQDNFLLHFSKEMKDTTKYEDRRIPLFEDVCRELGRTPINVEIKTAEEGIVEEVHRIITKYNKNSEVIWGFENIKNVTKLKEVDPDIARFSSLSEVMKISICYLFGLLPFINVDSDSVQLPLLNEGFIINRTRESKNMFKTRLTFYYLKLIDLLGGPMYIHLKKRGIDTILWVVNSEEELDRALAYEGVSGVMTDIPEEIIKLAKIS